MSRQLSFNSTTFGDDGPVEAALAAPLSGDWAGRPVTRITTSGKEKKSLQASARKLQQ